MLLFFTVIAQEIIIGDRTIKGPLRSDITTIWDLLSLLFNFGMGFVAIILVFTFIMAGYELINSQGNSEKFSDAKRKLTGAIIGLILLTSSFVIVKIVAYIFNLQGPGF
ncbi:MAG: hypothetical protein KatS3mg091_622 [Patescibacteria group bacterium]|nr:MAG: hypothetical protein KatS3mg091_622 [Patescibacteria group bacterium]